VAPADKKPNGTKEDQKSTCSKYRNSFLQWVDNNSTEAKEILGAKLMPVFPDYGNIMRRGCNGFAKEVMNWPVDMILGGVSDDGRDVKAEALQSVLLVSSATDIYRRFLEHDKISQLSLFNETTGQSTNLTSEWSPLMAREIINEWQRKFTAAIYNHKFNFLTVKNGDYEDRTVHRTVHPLAAASISDILSEYCGFNYNIIFFGYLLMVSLNYVL
jgi:patched 1 protein